jgi:hypothetical protein
MTIFRHEAIGALPDGEQFVFGVHSEKAAGSLSGAHSAWAAAVDDLWNGTATPADSIKQLYPSSIHIDEVVSTELDPITGKNLLQERSGVSLVGTGSGSALPQEVAVCVSLRTNLPTRAGRGRFFLPSPIVTTVSASRLAGTPQGQILAAAALMLGDMSAATFPVVILHRSTMTTDLVISVDVGDVFDSMRTRRDKLREVRVTAVV